MKNQGEKSVALFRCCMTSMGLKHYESASNAVLRELGITFADIKEFNCCGYPLRGYRGEHRSQGLRIRR